MLVVTVLTVVLGVLGALLVARTSIAFPRAWTVLLALPLAVPGFVSSYAVFAAELVYAPSLTWVTSFFGASLVLALSLYPYVFLPCVVALRTVDPAQEEMVANLRPRWTSRFWHVTLPALRPALAAGVLIVALHVLLAVRDGSAWAFNPEEDYVLMPGQVIIAMASTRGREDIEACIADHVG